MVSSAVSSAGLRRRPKRDFGGLAFEGGDDGGFGEVAELGGFQSEGALGQAADGEAALGVGLRRAAGAEDIDVGSGDGVERGGVRDLAGDDAVADGVFQARQRAGGAGNRDTVGRSERRGFIDGRGLP